MSYPDAFLSAIVVLLGPGPNPGGDEGGYSDDPNDPGGETNFGLDKRTYPDVDMKTVTKAQAIAIYYRDWWVPYAMYQMDTAVTEKMFNVAVNVGKSQANKFLQRAAGAYPDGVVGPKTLAAIKASLPTVLLEDIRSEQATFYRSLAEMHPALQKFLRGWLRRAAE